MGGGEGQPRGLTGGRAGGRSSGTARDSIRRAKVFITSSSACPSPRRSCGAARRLVRKSPALIKPPPASDKTEGGEIQNDN